MEKPPENIFSFQPIFDEESVASKRETGQQFMRELFPEETELLDRTYNRLDYKLQIVGKDIIVFDENDKSDPREEKKFSFRHDGKIYQSDIYNEEQIKEFLKVKEDIDKVDAPDQGESASLDKQIQEVESLINRLKKIFNKRKIIKVNEPEKRLELIRRMHSHRRGRGAKKDFASKAR